jgi:hypothetical protein
MQQDGIPDDVRDFILRHIDSVAQLEALLLLRRTPGERWDLAGIAQRLYAGEQEVADAVGRLCGDGLLSCNEGIYSYACEPAELRRTVDRLAEVYSRQLIPVTNLIHSKPRRIREFANAFKFRKDR